MSFFRLVCALLALLGLGAQTAPPALDVQAIAPAFATETVATDPDDPAVWVNRKKPEQSLLIGTNKAALVQGGALHVWGLDGKTRQVIKLDRPNNVDVEYNVQLGSQTVDIAVVTERNKNALRFYKVTGAGLTELAPLGGVRVFAGETGDFAAPMGVALYKRPKDKAVFAVVGRKSGPKSGYLWQYQVGADANEAVQLTEVRRFGNYSGKKEIESIAVDDELGFVYYSDEMFGVRQYHADPDHKNASRELALFATSERDGFTGDHEGIAVYAKPQGGGYLVCTDQIAGNARYYIYTRQGTKTKPYEHRRIAVLAGGSDETDGIEVINQNFGPRFPKGLLVTMNSGPKNFLVFDWQAVQSVIDGQEKQRK